MEHQQVIQFWFEQIEASQWFKKDREFDALIRERFLNLYQRALRGELWAWRESALGRLAEILVLDQFPRNMFRDQAEAFASDGLALLLAQEAVAGGFDAQLRSAERAFLYMPFMHSESLAMQEHSLRLFLAAGLERNQAFAEAHYRIIKRFGRFPHRNAALGRASSAEELAFLQQPGSGF